MTAPLPLPKPDVEPGAQRGPQPCPSPFLPSLGPSWPSSQKAGTRPWLRIQRCAFGAGLAPPPAAPQSPPHSELTDSCSTHQDQALYPDPEFQGHCNSQGKGHGEPCFPFLLGPSGVSLSWLSGCGDRAHLNITSLSGGTDRTPFSV